jgi:hypothetical protein
MPIQARWSKFTRENVERTPQKEGVYDLANAKKSIIRHGSSNNLRRRLMTHLIDERLSTVRYFRCEYIDLFDIDTPKAREAHHAERYFAQHGRKPRYTKRSPHKTSLFDF